MSALTVAVEGKGAKRPQYRDYVTFLGNYKNGKKDDQCSVATNDSGVGFSLDNSSNNSSSSINSDLTDAPKNGFKEYLEQYNNKKYSSVQPSFIKKQNVKQPEEAKTIKTEVYIEINNTPSQVSQVTKVFEVNNANNVNKVSKIFEKPASAGDSAPVPKPQPSGKVNTFQFEHKETESQCGIKQEQKKTSIGEISKKFEANSKSPPHKVQLKKTPSISEKSKLFEDKNHVVGRKNSFSEASKVFQQKEESAILKTNRSVSPKLPINNAKPEEKEERKSSVNEVSKVFQQKEESIIPKTSRSISPKLSVNNVKPEENEERKNISEVSKVFQQKEETIAPKTNGSTSPKPPINIIKPAFVPKPPANLVPAPPNLPPPQPAQTSCPPPPAPPQPSPQTCSIPPPPPPQTFSIPPPPPPPPANFTPKTHSPPKPVAQKSVTNGTTQNGRKSNDSVDGAAVPVVDKNDPRVKRLVYGALREMYGAYHDKANDYIATLPKNRVKKNNGLDSIISSIASQGGLDKLNGRVNPTVENE